MTSGIEIERAWLLIGRPDLPHHHASITIEQGYLLGADGQRHDGRLRRAAHADGRIECTFTRKSGDGLIRQESEVAIDEAEFARRWPGTEGRRLRKIRHVAQDDGLRWEIDEFLTVRLWLAEVELPTPDAHAAPPGWLAPWVDREVTTDPRYRNSALALRGLPNA